MEGVAAIQDELKIFTQVASSVTNVSPVEIRCQWGLSWQEAKEWLQACDQVGIESRATVTSGSV